MRNVGFAVIGAALLVAAAATNALAGTAPVAPEISPGTVAGGLGLLAGGVLLLRARFGK